MTEHEACSRQLARLETWARIMDDAVYVPILRFRVGLDPLLGLFPGIGDMAGAALSGWMVITAARLGASASTLAQMLMNLALDAAVGAIPVFGDVFDLLFKANRRNLDIVKRQVADPEGARRRSRITVTAAVVAVVTLIAAMALLLAWTVAGAWKVLAG